tara:strand:+ start:61 stop:210 length:150 start_codon:yes stop_codon:yes gene_type:complete
MNASLSFVIICGVDQDANAWVNKNPQKIIIIRSGLTLNISPPFVTGYIY